MSKLIIMKGLPASGKSTKAEEILRASGNCVRINKDLLRTMLHFDKWSGHNEEMTRHASRALAKEFILANKNVIIDDTNLNEGTLQSWKDFAKELSEFQEHKIGVEIVEMNTSLEECILRDRIRGNKSVGRDVIIQMALQSGLYPMPEKGFVLCDLDGTIADITHRLHFVKNLPEGAKKDWRSFFEGIKNDVPRNEVIDQVMNYEGMGHPIVFVSARPDTYREATEEWLAKIFKGYRPHSTLIMRKGGDSREDTVVKQQILDTYFKKHNYPIECVFDDRPSVIRMWRSNNLMVHDVGAGIEF